MNKQGIDLLKKILNDYPGWDYDKIRKQGYVGFAHIYLQRSWDETALVNKADVKVYEELFKIDNQLDTTITEQLYWCVCNSLRLDLVKV